MASEFNVRMFADDTNLTMVSDNYLSLQTKVNCEIQKIDNWLKSNKVSLNCNKTEYMVVTRKKEKCNFHINIGGHEISQKECIRYLGVMLDNYLTWKQHTAHVSRKLSNGCWALSQIRKYSNSQMIKKVYFALLYPYIQCCISSWGCAAKSVLDPLIKLQKRMVRMMTFSPNKASSMPLFHKLNLLTLNDVFKLEIAEVMHNIENNKHLPDYISKNFERVNWTQKFIKIKATMYYRKLEWKLAKKSIFYWPQRSGKKFHWISNQNLYCCLKKYANYLISYYINRWCLQSMNV